MPFSQNYQNGHKALLNKACELILFVELLVERYLKQSDRLIIERRTLVSVTRQLLDIMIDIKTSRQVDK